ncbi:DUF4350 domain-containing protein [Actinobacteria bacterium YIM 96077]|uniref:DUF4350 domain-containing protein n=1 Tax=Phytoactinopolyspora halophila TaxID=1981511 RepID=A0A329R2A6_9ACTN|nr:DUF4350 domain-containing protein [Phytoactinopolyspora halophila]AYY12059.1 DUF4350 domain-containing protein [Actinobacteria bacterium YIM 96077]RAW18707.1 DUF4350 domain-containing protein [Phytoactinopolyspora halophila]
MTAGDVSTVRTPTARQHWRRWRFPFLVTAALVIFAVVITLLQDQTSRGYLDPEGVNVSGARALARLLEDQGLTITPVRTTADAVSATSSDETIVITEPDMLLPEQIDDVLGTGADIVLVTASNVEDFGPDLEHAGSSPEQVLAPRCELPAARSAGDALTGGETYHGPDDATACYPTDDGASLLVGSSHTGSRLVALGSSAPLTNRYLDENGNAALALNLLGQTGELTWYRPTPEGAPDEARDLADLMPGWVVPAAWQLAIAVGVAAWWRARRLGRVVTEPLPVVVRAAETTEGRARLYARGGSRGHAASILRNATARRLRSRLSVPLTAPAEALIEAVSARTEREPETVTTLLAGPEPTDDAGLVRLANALDELEQEVITS